MSPFEAALAAGQQGAKLQQRVHEGAVDRRDMSAIDAILQNAMATGDQNAIDQAKANILLQVSPKNQQRAMSILERKEEQLAKAAEQQRRQYEFASEMQFKERQLASQEKRAAEQLASQERRTAATLASQESRAKKTETEDKSLIQSTINRMDELLPKVGVTSGAYSLISGDTMEARAEMYGLGAAIESKLVKMVNKGTLSNTRFNYMLSLIPKPGTMVRYNRGLLKALAHELGVEYGEAGAVAAEGEQLSLEDIIP